MDSHTEAAAETSDTAGEAEALRRELREERALRASLRGQLSAAHQNYQALCGQLGKRVYVVRRRANDRAIDIERKAYARVRATVDKASRVGRESQRVVEELARLAQQRDKAIQERRRAVNRARKYEADAKRVQACERQDAALAETRSLLEQSEDGRRAARRRVRVLESALAKAESLAGERLQELKAVQTDLRAARRQASMLHGLAQQATG